MTNFSKNSQNMRSSEIRELMSLATRPDMISFAGGMPNNSLFPLDEIEEIYVHLSREVKQAGFQYGPTHGYPPLCAALKEYLKSKGLPIEGHELMITTGSQQAIHLVTRVYIDPGDVIVAEDPCFIGGITAARAHQGVIRSVPMDEEGMDIDLFRQALDRQDPVAKMVYLTPNFHNPAGLIYPRERREKVLQTLEGRDVVLLEDDAYGELYFDEADHSLVTPLKAMGPNPVPTCYTGSFSKIMGPGFRLGWLLAPIDILRRCELAKQSIDACTATFPQVIAHGFLSSGKLFSYISRMRRVYAHRARLMLDALQRFMPAESHWNTPRGGFYIWVHLPPGMDATEVLKKAIDAGVVFIIGKTFDPCGQKNDCLRLAFSHTPEDKMAHGIEILAQSLRSCMTG